MEINLIKKLFSKASDDLMKHWKFSLRPSTRLRKLLITKPVERRLSIRSYAPEKYFSGRISDVYREMRDVYGNIPLWVKYSSFPTSVSWNLGNVYALHNIHVYGEDKYVKEFLLRLGEVLSSDRLGDITAGVNILDKVLSQFINDFPKNDDSKLLPAELQKNHGETTLRSSLLNTSGLIAGLAGTVLALSLFSLRKSNNQKHRVSREEALQAAIACVKRVTSTSPILRSEEFVRGHWHFILSNYLVTVSSNGKVIEIREVKNNV